MINVRSIRKLYNNDGLTLKAGKPITYKTGWQVADHGVECHTPEEAIKAVKAMGGNAGIWLCCGVYYVDHSFRVNTKKEAMKIGRENHQLTVLNWKNMKLSLC